MIRSKNLIMGFDPGLINTGWGVLQKNDKLETCIDYGSISTSKNDHLGMRLKKFMKKVCFY